MFFVNQTKYSNEIERGSKMNPREFSIDGHLKPRLKFVSTDKYAKILDTVVITCVDIIVACKNKVLLGKRRQKPNQSWWIMGGRMHPGESFDATASRNIKREIKIKVNSSRFFYMNVYSITHGKRLQQPQKNGSHTVSITMTLTITEEELATIKPNTEYSDLRLFQPEDIISDNSFTQPLRSIMEDFLR